MPSTLYDVLQVPETADPATIKAAYRRLVKTAHPDLVPEHEKPEAQLRFVVLQEAYDTLRDDTRRSVYDRELRAARQQQAATASRNPTGSDPTGPSTPPPRTAPPPPSAATSSPRIPVSLLRELFPNITNQELAAAYAAAADANANGDPDAFLKMVHDLRQRHPRPGDPMGQPVVDPTVEYRRRTKERSSVAAATIVLLPLLAAWTGVFASGSAADPSDTVAAVVQRWTSYWQQSDHAMLIPVAVIVGFVTGWFNTWTNTFIWNLYLQHRGVRTGVLTVTYLTVATTPYWFTDPDVYLVAAAAVSVTVAVTATVFNRRLDQWFESRTVNPVTWIRWRITRR